MKITEAAQRVLKEDPRTRDPRYQWLYILKVLQLIGIKVYVPLFDKRLPSPDSMLVLRRTLLHKKNLYPDDFTPEPGVTYEKIHN